MVYMWKPLDGELAAYEVSSDGRVRNARTGKTLSAYTNEDGYHRVSLWLNGRPANRYVHRLVAQAFLESWDAELTVDHLNGVRHDNRPENLRMATLEQQCENKKRSRARAGVDIAEAEKIDGEVWKEFNETTKVSNKGRLSRKRGKTWTIRAAGDLVVRMGYPSCKVGYKDTRLHTLVAQLFVPKPTGDASLVVTHLDGDRINTAAGNLAWITRSESARRRNTRPPQETGGHHTPGS